MRKRKSIDITRILELTKKNLTVREIAQQEGISVHLLYIRIEEAKGTSEYEEYKRIKETTKNQNRKNHNKGNQNRRNNIEITRILELTKQNLTVKEIAQQEGVSVSILYRRIEEAKGTPEYEEYKRIKNQPRKKRINIDITRILKLTKKGLTLEQIALQEEVSLRVLYRRIKEAEGTPEYGEYMQVKTSIKKPRKQIRKRKNIDITRILELTKKGLTLEQIALQEEVSLRVIYRRIKEAEGTLEYEEYLQTKKQKIYGKQSRNSKKTFVGILPNNKILITFMLQNGATPEETTEIFTKKGLQLNVRERLEQYIERISTGRLKLTALERNMISYINRLLNIKMEDIAELERLVINKSPIHRISSKTNLEELVQQYNSKSGKSFSRLEMEFVLNRIKNAKEKIIVSPLIIQGESLIPKIENMYDEIQLENSQKLR